MPPSPRPRPLATELRRRGLGAIAGLAAFAACSGGLPDDCGDYDCPLLPVLLKIEGDYEAGSRIEFCGGSECITANVEDTELETENFAPYLVSPLRHESRFFGADRSVGATTVRVLDPRGEVVATGEAAASGPGVCCGQLTVTFERP